MALEMLWTRTTRTDRWLILLLLLLALASLWLSIGRSVGSQVIIYENEQIAFVGPLDQARHLDLQGPLGITQVEIAGGKVRVTSSPCPRKICIAMGDAHRSGDLLACVPNLVVVRIEGEETKGYDLLSR